jgi:SAM-dependent methyltransferase
VTDPPAEALRERNRAGFDGVGGGIYSFYIQRPALSRVVGGLVWGGSTAPFYESLSLVRTLPDGALVVDAPCGAGVAFAALSPRQDVRYLALDISTGMLARAGERARKLGLQQIELAQGDAIEIPVDDGSVDLFLSWWGLHCLPDPEAAVHEAARCLRRGGRMVGGMICRGTRVRQRLLVRPGRGLFGPGGTTDDLAAWIERAGLRRERLCTSGPFAYFEASA